MKPSAFKNVVAPLLLLLALSILPAACYYPGPPPNYPPDYPGDGYYGGYYPGYYGADVIIDVGGHHDRDDRRHYWSHMPERRIPAPAPRRAPYTRREPVRR